MPSDVPAHGYDFVVVANRLPVDVSLDDDGEPTWTRSPGGLVTALAPVMASTSGAWVGWGGSPDLELDPFDVDGTELIPVTLTEDDLEQFYEGFSNDTLWPLYHDVIEPPGVPPAVVGVVPEGQPALRGGHGRAGRARARPCGCTTTSSSWSRRCCGSCGPTCGSATSTTSRSRRCELFAQLPWRVQVVEGLLGADLVGFQRAGDAANFVRVVRRLHGPDHARADGARCRSTASPAGTCTRPRSPSRSTRTRFDELARTDARPGARAEDPAELGDPEYLLLGVDRLDYTKGIRHRIKAYGELLSEERLVAASTTLVQVASPSRENVGAYQTLRDEVELLVGRINGDHGQVGHAPVQYLHQSFPMEEMAALYLAADVMLVTPLRDGMNLVAKEYVARPVRRPRRAGAVASSPGAADELTGAVLVNPHDIEGMKDAITYAVHMDARESRKRMRRLRRRVLGHDVVAWSEDFLAALNAVPVRAGRG